MELPLPTLIVGGLLVGALLATRLYAIVGNVKTALALAKDPDALFAKKRRRGLTSFALFSQTFVLSHSLIRAAYAAPLRILDAAPITIKNLTNVFGVGKRAVRDYPNVFQNVVKTAHRGLSKQCIVDACSRFTSEFALRMASLVKEGATEILLHDLLLGAMFESSSFALFGPRFPAKQILSSFETFDEGVASLTILGTMLAPIEAIGRRLFHSKTFAARRVVLDCFKVWIDDGGPDEADEMIKDLAVTMREGGWSTSDAAGQMLGLLWGLHANSNNAAFFAIMHVAQSSATLQRIREEVDALPDSAAGGTSGLSSTTILTALPVTTSVVYETLRIYTSIFSARIVQKEALLSVPPLPEVPLRDGSLLITTNRSVHIDEEIWGSDALRWDGFRFLGEGRELTRYLTIFGGGHSICPGRHFAIFELVAAVALFASLFDVLSVEAVDFAGETVPRTADAVLNGKAYLIASPGARSGRIGLGTMHPAGDVRLRIRPRQLH